MGFADAPVSLGSAEFGFLTMEWHYRFGYATLALIVFRVLWGFAGSQTSRFGEFVRGPSAVVRYLKASVSPNPPTQVGHNPLGGWSVVVMLLCVLVQAVSGLFASDGIDEDGPFVGAVSNATVKLATRLHHLGETALLVLITLHVAAVLLHWALKHDNLIVPMITGRKRADGPVPLRFVSGWLALALFVIATAAIVMLSRAGN